MNAIVPIDFIMSLFLSPLSLNDYDDSLSFATSHQTITINLNIIVDTTTYTYTHMLMPFVILYRRYHLKSALCLNHCNDHNVDDLNDDIDHYVAS